MINVILAGLENTRYATAIRTSDFLFPTVETIHVIALTLVIGTIAMLDLRLLGISSRNRRVTEVAAQVLPWTWSAFAVAATTGFLLFSSAAVKYWAMDVFRAKMVLIACAGINMLIFHFTTYHSVARWDGGTVAPITARTAAGLSLVFWTGVVFCGRWMGFL